MPHPPIRALQALDAPGSFEGYASIFNLADDGRDLVVPGAFRAAIQARGPAGVRLLWQHDPKEPIGVVEGLVEDQRGLKIKGRLLLDIDRGAAAYRLMLAGALDGLSIGYRVKRAEIDRMSGLRNIIEVDLWEISLVTFPMQRLARLTAIKAGSIRDYETFLRDAGGFSRREAKALAAHGFAALAPRDAAACPQIWADIGAGLRRAHSLITTSLGENHHD